MIPAYCAHQVCNLADCIKIACDFLSPRNSAIRRFQAFADDPRRLSLDLAQTASLDAPKSRKNSEGKM